MLPNYSAAASSIWSPRLFRPAAERRVIRSSPRCPLRTFRGGKYRPRHHRRLGDNYLARRGAGGELARRRRASITSVFPSTTAAAITTSYTAARRSSTGSPAGSPTSAQPAASLPLCSSAAVARTCRCSREVFPPPRRSRRHPFSRRCCALDRRHREADRRFRLQRAPLRRRARAYESLEGFVDETVAAVQSGPKENSCTPTGRTTT